jgi:hypothetical protein
MADKKISALSSASLPLAGTEVLPIVQSSTTVKVATDDLTVKNIRSNATTGILQVTGPAASSTRTMTVPNANFTAARTDAAQSFTGNQTLGTGNLIQGTAAKGVDFSANSAAAGMTSQLLNWYEEGAYTPTVAATSGTITSYTVTAAYTRVGRQVTVVANVTVTNAGTGAGAITITLPWTANGSYAFNGAGRENALTGYMLQAYIAAGDTVVNAVGYDNTTAIATNAQIRVTITYFV